MEPDRGAPSRGRAASRLFVTSAALLFTELVLIRWIPANVTYVGFFTNLLLIGSFLGIGAGILIGRRGFEPRVPVFPLLLLAVVFLVTRAQLDLHVSTQDEVFFGITDRSAAAPNFFVLPAVIALATLVLAALALPLGPLLRSLPPLRAYAIDIAGSLVGIALFAGLSAAGTPPMVWFSVLGALLLIMGALRGPGAWSLVSAAALAATVFLNAGSPDVWSPYYRITDSRSGPMESLSVNGIPHQLLWPVKAIEGQGMPYDQLYRWVPGRRFGRVLIVGAGSGTDVAVALAHGAGHVDAVEIDPVIASIGVARHPDRPYQDERVTLHVDDGRSFLRKTDARYDLIVFALPDSLTLASAMADVRLESFLFTQEAFDDVRAHLAPGGIFTLYNFYRQPWIIERIASMLERSFGGGPLIAWRKDSSLAILAAGDQIRAPRPPELVRASLPDYPRDDWPFLYLKRPMVPAHYLIALACVVGFAAVLLGGAKRASGLTGFSPHFFALGAAFMLLEARSLVAFSLLFGTTWLVNALAFFAILTSVLASIGVTALVRLPSRLLYALLVVTLAVAYLVPPESLLLEPRWLRYLLASLVAFAPIFAANLVFSASFKDSEQADMAFASNLLGATLGGALEYVALATGYRALGLVAGLLYAIAFATRGRPHVPGPIPKESS